ncbi:MAG: NAD(P)H-binding protein [Candidatus Andeanibacterium colombiense]|uniref:NAD(P)H-binding protein n=1 Tax=Candidatus Andeanibacterium colombiense TaxID=3121345 RepID=A0AAJ6BPX2_9SPHN|nr:MAG: NAD(P)H-binding protein [Sphingomonadaceae bacterium]
MSEPVKLALFGSTGLMGRTIMEELVGNTDFRLTAVARREVPLPQGARMEMRLAPSELWPEVIETVKPDVLVCALGTTWRKAGRDADAFRAVDQKLVMEVAQAAKALGVPHFIFISSVGASLSSKTLYLQVKGEVEIALGKLHFKRLDILRPGLIRGSRRDDIRVGEGLGRIASPIADLFLQGSNRRYRSITAHRLAEAILGLALEKAGGKFIHEHDALQRAVHRFEKRYELEG